MFPAQPVAQPAQPAPPQQQPGASWARPHLGTAPGAAPSGGAFGGSAASAGGRSNSAPPGQYAATPSQFSMPAGQSPQQTQQPAAPYAQPPQPGYTQPLPQQVQPYPQAPQRPGSQSGAPYPQPQQPGSPPGGGPGGYPPNVYGQLGVRPATAAEAPKPKSRRGLLIVVGGLVAVGAGIAIAVGVSGGGKKTGTASRDEVVQGSLTALGAGDSDALVALMSLDTSKDQIECDDAAKLAEFEKVLKTIREQVTKTAARAKGLQIELVKSTADRTQVLKKGEAVGPCKLKLEVTTHELKLSLKIKQGSVVKEREKTISLTEVDGRWFLANPPAIEPPGDCSAAAKTTAKNGREVYAKEGLGGTAMARIEKAFGAHCVDDGWADDVITCFIDAESDDANKKCLAMMPQSQHDKLVKHVRQIVVEDLKSRAVPVVAPIPSTPVVPPMPGVDPTAPPTPGTGSGSASAVAAEEIPPICNDYQAELEKLSKCRRIRAGVRAAQRKNHELIVEGWNNTRAKDKIRASTEKLCQTGLARALDLRKTQCR